MTSPDQANQIISLKKVELTLGADASKVNILNGVDFCVMAGETVSIVGPSGSGKTSLMLVIGGLENASNGIVEIA
jgi:putative ABC transport system ATP-binding protein